MRKRGMQTRTDWSIKTLPRTRTLVETETGLKAEYASDCNASKVDKVVSARTARAISHCNGLPWSPAMEDAVLTGKATMRRSIFDKEKGATVEKLVPVIHAGARHPSHGGFYDQKRATLPATRTRVEPTQADLDEADRWSRENDGALVA